MAEWDLTKSGWGRSIHADKVGEDWAEIRLIGHHPQAHKFAAGDTVILPSRLGTMRYLLESVNRFRDPPDMWSGTASFFPREPAPEPTS